MLSGLCDCVLAPLRRVGVNSLTPLNHDETTPWLFMVVAPYSTKKQICVINGR